MHFWSPVCYIDLLFYFRHFLEDGDEKLYKKKFNISGTVMLSAGFFLGWSFAMAIWCFGRHDIVKQRLCCISSYVSQASLADVQHGRFPHIP